MKSASSNPRPRRRRGPGGRAAILLIGPTGSGKSPLGALLERTGLRGRQCTHFDFGACMRRIASARRPPKPFTRRNAAAIRKVLETGALLDNRQFYLASKTLKWFLSSAGPERAGLVVLNGMPRHVGQAERLGRALDVQAVIRLACAAGTTRERIRRDTGGDRAGRRDDTAAAVAARLAVFEKRTAPLLAYYRSRGVPVATIRVGPRTTAEQMLRRLQQLRIFTGRTA